jgi:hypothetical protein
MTRSEAILRAIADEIALRRVEFDHDEYLAEVVITVRLTRRSRVPWQVIVGKQTYRTIPSSQYAEVSS